MKETVLMIIWVIGFFFLAGSVGACEYGDISCSTLIIRAVIAFAVLALATIILDFEEIREAVKEYWRMKKRSRTR